MCRSYKIEIMNTFFNKRIKDFHELSFTHFFTECSMADLVILTVYTTEIASGKKNSPGTACSADYGFFPEMESGAGKNRVKRTPAEPFCLTVNPLDKGKFTGLNLYSHENKARSSCEGIILNLKLYKLLFNIQIGFLVSSSQRCFSTSLYK